jgi:MFS superfamily sulfate permease-like transporter
VPDSRGRSLRARLRAPPVMGGLLPVRGSEVAVDVLAGITLAAVSIPVSLGYAKIAGMPVVTGLYTLLLPMAVFAIFGSARHLVVCADSATAAILGAALAGFTAVGSPQYVRLAGHWQPVPVLPGARTEEGLVIYRFGTSLYYANASRLIDDVTALAAQGSPLRWVVLDCAAIGDVDYTAAQFLTRVIEHLRKRHIRLAVSAVLGPVREQLDRYGISAALGPGAYYETPCEALEAFHAAEGATGK